MRILHTADLHLGRQFSGISLEEDHAAILEQILDVAIGRQVDVLVIAGDIFDRAAPPETAVRQFNGFLRRVAEETSAAVVMIAGNHDSGHRIGAMAIMTDARRALIRGPVSAEETPLLLEDEHGTVAISALPFAYEYAARECFADETLSSPAEVLAAQVAAARAHVPVNARWVVAAHAFVAGGEGSESERPLARVGGIETVPSDVFAGAHYVALGHLHRAQTAGAEHIRYSGSPLAFGFDEADAEKSMTLVEIDGSGEAMVETIPFSPARRVRVLRGTLAELLLADPSPDFIRAVLTDEHPLIDPMKRLRAVFPNACQLSYARDEKVSELKPLSRRPVKLADPVEMIGDFLDHVRDERLREAEEAVVGAALHDLRAREEGA